MKGTLRKFEWLEFEWLDRNIVLLNFCGPTIPVGSVMECDRRYFSHDNQRWFFSVEYVYESREAMWCASMIYFRRGYSMECYSIPCWKVTKECFHSIQSNQPLSKSDELEILLLDRNLLPVVKSYLSA